jgi:TonB family protein
VEVPRRGSQLAATLPAGFGAAGVAAASPHHQTSAASSNGFGGVAAAPPSQPPAARPSPAGTSFTAAAAAAPVQAPTRRRPVAEPLEILFKPRPVYTDEARRARIEGDIVLEVLFPGTGNPRVLRVVRGLGYGLEQNALDAAAQIRFRPSSEEGRPVDTVAMVRIAFQLAY